MEGSWPTLCGFSEEFPINLHGLLGDGIPREIADPFPGRGAKLGRPSAILVQGAHLLSEFDFASQICEQQPIDSVLNEFGGSRFPADDDWKAACHRFGDD